MYLQVTERKVELWTCYLLRRVIAMVIPLFHANFDSPNNKSENMETNG